MQLSAGLYLNRCNRRITLDMHEMSTCKRILSELEKLALSTPEKKLVAFTLTIGELARVDVEELRYLFPMAAKGTFAENAKMTIEATGLSIYCPHCHQTATVHTDNLDCPNCLNQETVLQNGTEMLLSTVEFA